MRRFVNQRGELLGLRLARKQSNLAAVGDSKGRGDLLVEFQLDVLLCEECNHPVAVLAHFAGFYPRPRDVDEVIALVGLGEKRDERARKLSGGQRRRLDLALALIGDPELIFLDEPTTGFDPAARRTAWQTIRSLKDLGKTVLLTTHYLDEAQELADRVAIIKGGQILAEGSPAQLGVGGGSRYRVAYLRDGEPVIAQTDDPTRLLHELTGEALAAGGTLEGLSVTRPSLEEIYLELTADA